MRTYLASWFFGLAVASSIVHAQQFPTGLTYLNKKTYSRIPLASTTYGGSLPSAAFISHEPAVISQGKQPSCTAFAVAYAARSILENERRDWGLDSEDHLFSPAFLYNQIHRGNCQSGTGFVDALNVLVDKGIATLAAFPYEDATCARVPNEAEIAAASVFRISEWRRVNTLSPTEVKAHIVNSEPVMFGMDVDDAFERLASGSVYQHQQGKNYGGHAMVVDGYDDNKGAFRIFNSWGPAWSENGRGWIAYSTFSELAEEAYVISAPTVHDPVRIERTAKVTTSLWRDIAKEQKSVKTVVRKAAIGIEQEASLLADSGSRLTNPKLRCVGKRCDYNNISAISLDDSGSRATAAWNPTTAGAQWVLSAEQHSVRKAADLMRRVAVGSEFSVLQEVGQPTTEVTVAFGDGTTTSFDVGREPVGKSVVLTGASTDAKGTHFTYRVPE
jgi:hypothetical protein